MFSSQRFNGIANSESEKIKKSLRQEIEKLSTRNFNLDKQLTNTKTESKDQKTENATLRTTIESQKEEIKNVSLDYCGAIDVLEAKVESLKAITELAVNALKEELQAAKVWDMDGTVRNIQAVLAEIERLQNGTT